MTNNIQDTEDDTVIDRSNLKNMKSGDINYNGVSFVEDLGVTPLKFSPTVAPNISDTQEDIPAKYGTMFEGTDYQGKSLTIPIAILNVGSDYDKFTDIIRALSNVLIDTDPVDIGDEFPLIYGVNPDITYYGRFTAIGNPNYAYGDDKLDCTIDLTFEMSDPRAYLPLENWNNKVNQSDNLLVGTSNTVITGSTTGWGDVMQYSLLKEQRLHAGDIFSVRVWLNPASHDCHINATGTQVSDGKEWWASDHRISLTTVPAGHSGYSTLVFSVDTDITNVRIYSSFTQSRSDKTNISWKEAKLCVWPDIKTEPDMTWSPAEGESGFLKGKTTSMDVTPTGTAPADPIVSIIPKRDLKYVGYLVNNQHFAVGSDQEEIQSSVQDKYTNMLADNADTTAPWTNDSSAISPITTGVNKFTPQGSYAASHDGSSVLHLGKTDKGNYDFGPVVKNGWYGPLLRYEGLTKSLKDFKVSVMIHHKKYAKVTRGDTGLHNGRAMGDVEFLLLDPNGRTIGRCAIKDQSGGRVPYCYFQLGVSGSSFSSSSDHHNLYVGKGVHFKNGPNKTFKITMSTSTKTKKFKKVKYVRKSRRRRRKTYTTVSKKVKIKNQVKVMNDDNISALTDGWVQFNLERVGKVFTWSIIQYNLKKGVPYRDKTKHLIKSGQYVDNEGKFQDRLGSFGLGLWKMAISEDIAKPAIPYRNAYLSITDLQVWKINNITPKQPVVVCKAGQEIRFNTTLNKVTVDGRQVYPEWTTDYPRLRPGVINTFYYVGDIADAQLNIDYYPRLK